MAHYTCSQNYTQNAPGQRSSQIAEKTTGNSTGNPRLVLVVGNWQISCRHSCRHVPDMFIKKNSRQRKWVCLVLRDPLSGGFPLGVPLSQPKQGYPKSTTHPFHLGLRSHPSVFTCLTPQRIAVPPNFQQQHLGGAAPSLNTTHQGKIARTPPTGRFPPLKAPADPPPARSARPRGAS